jgi:hypothetical protein
VVSQFHFSELRFGKARKPHVSQAIQNNPAVEKQKARRKKQISVTYSEYYFKIAAMGRKEGEETKE